MTVDLKKSTMPLEIRVAKAYRQYTETEYYSDQVEKAVGGVSEILDVGLDMIRSLVEEEWKRNPMQPPEG